MESQPHKVTVPVSSAVGKNLRARQTDTDRQTDRRRKTEGQIRQTKPYRELETHRQRQTQTVRQRDRNEHTTAETEGGSIIYKNT